MNRRGFLKRLTGGIAAATAAGTAVAVSKSEIKSAVIAKEPTLVKTVKPEFSSPVFAKRKLKVPEAARHTKAEMEGAICVGNHIQRFSGAFSYADLEKLREQQIKAAWSQNKLTEFVNEG